MNEKQIEYSLDKEIIVFTTTTMSRLFNLSSSDPWTLYSFLVRHAKLQETNKVWANNQFCKNGLNWGSDRLETAKTILEEESFIDLIPQSKNDTERFGKSYIKLHYVTNPAYSDGPEETTTCSVPPETVNGEPVDGSQATNAYNKKEMLKNEESTLLPKGNKVASDHASCLDPEIYNEGVLLNIFWKHTIGKGSHKSLNSKFLITGKYGGSERKSLPVWAPITSAIRNVGLEALKQGIRYFKETQDTDKYMLGSTWTLAEFCHNKNYQKYIDGVPEKKFASKDPWDAIRAEFLPLTSVCSQVFDTKTQRYYGFQLDKINSEIRWEDTISWLTARNDQWIFNAFMELEWMIAGMLWRRKKGNQDELETCQEYMIKWEELKDGFKKEARKWLKEDWELYG